MKQYLVNGPGDRKWSIWDHGDEMSVTDGPKLTDRLVATVPQRLCSRLTPEEKFEHVRRAASAIQTAAWLNADEPNLNGRGLWRTR